MSVDEITKIIEKLRDLLDPEYQDVAGLVDSYLNGWINTGFEDLSKHQTFMNSAFVVIDALRPYVRKPGLIENFEAGLTDPDMKQRYENLKHDLLMFAMSSYGAGVLTKV